MTQVLNAISVDYEEYFRAASLKSYLGSISPPSRLSESLDITLNVLSEYKIKATFFILGREAEDRPDLIKRISECGHELASHSMDHEHIFKLSPVQFREQASSSKKIIEDISGREVLGFRAPNFSIIPGTEWAYEILIESGYLYDSSAYPVWHPSYKNTSHATNVHKIKTKSGEIISVPLAVMKCGGMNLPVAGGAYWRLLPEKYIRAGIEQINLTGMPAYTYFHPWELDAGQPKLIPKYHLTYYRHYGGVAQFANVLKRYFTKYKFDTYINVLKKYSETLIKI